MNIGINSQSPTTGLGQNYVPDRLFKNDEW